MRNVYPSRTPSLDTSLLCIKSEEPLIFNSLSGRYLKEKTRKRWRGCSAFEWCPKKTLHIHTVDEFIHVYFDGFMYFLSCWFFDLFVVCGGGLSRMSRSNHFSLSHSWLNFGWHAIDWIGFAQLLLKPKFSGIEKIKTIGSTYMTASGLRPGKEEGATVSYHSKIRRKNSLMKHFLVLGRISYEKN